MYPSRSDRERNAKPRSGYPIKVQPIVTVLQILKQVQHDAKLIFEAPSTLGLSRQYRLDVEVNRVLLKQVNLGFRLQALWLSRPDGERNAKPRSGYPIKVQPIFTVLQILKQVQHDAKLIFEAPSTFRLSHQYRLHGEVNRLLLKRVELGRLVEACIHQGRTEKGTQNPVRAIR